ncbi:MAG TPA: PHB depolymerase family esterase [Longimicrobiales bacterium]
MRTILIGALCLLAACESATEPPAVYQYETILPAGYDQSATTTFPVIFALHGANGIGDMEPVFRAAAAANPEFIVIMPDAEEHGWVTSSLRGTLADVVANYRVDSDRIYGTGMSAGAYAIWRLAASRPEDFAALVLVAGGGLDDFACGLSHIPVWLVHNQNDPVVPPSESTELYNAIQACDGLAQLTIYTTVPPGRHPHDAWSATYGGSYFYDWLLRHERGTPGPLD